MGHVLYKTTDYEAAIYVTDQSGAPLNLDGKSLELVVKRYPGQDPLVTLTNGAGITYRDQLIEPGYANVMITAAQSADLDAPSLHIVHVKLDGRVVMRPRHLEVVQI